MSAYDYAAAPTAVLASLRAWGDREGDMQPGGLVIALLENDLHAAVTRLHRSVSIDGLRDLVWFCSMELPALAWGSPERVAAWRDHVLCERELARHAHWCQVRAGTHFGQMPCNCGSDAAAGTNDTSAS